MKKIAALLLFLSLTVGVAWGGEITLYNYGTGQYEAIDTETGDFEECIPYIPVARNLYIAYVATGMNPLKAFIKVIETFYPERWKQ